MTKGGAWGVGLLIGSAAAMAAESVPAAPLTSKVGWLQWSMALLLVFAALAAFFFLLRRLGGATGLGSRHLKILAGISLGARERVVLLQTGNKQLVLGVSPGRIQTLCVLEGNDRVPTETPVTTADPKEHGFASQLNDLLKRGESPP